MTEKEAQKVLDELNTVRIEVLNDKAKRLFEAIMKIADERDELKKTIAKKDFEISSLKQVHDYDTKMIDDVKGKAVELYDRIEEKDKIIDSMAETINNYDIDEDICEQMGQNKNCNEFEDKERCKICIKQYFKNKLKEV